MNRKSGNMATKPLFWLKWGVPMALIIGIKTAQFFPSLIENVYSTHWYVSISEILRILTGWIPFSLGDILYGGLAIFLLIKVVLVTRLLLGKKLTWKGTGMAALRIVKILMWIYIWFNLAWGLNYHRLGIAHQLGLQKFEYCKEDVRSLTREIIQKLNECRRQIKDTTLPQPSLAEVFKGAYNSYENVSKEMSFLTYHHGSVKSSLYSSSLGSYFGFTGYYDPFSGEAQVRSDIPRVLIPYISCHEMAHQLGYASESDANFVGYLAASSSDDVYFRYSVYLDLFSYAQGQEVISYLAERDVKGLIQEMKKNRTDLDTLVKNDRKQIREFFFKRRNRISPLVSGLYDQYLKMNHQLAGINSYDEVIDWLIAYRKKYGKL